MNLSEFGTFESIGKENTKLKKDVCYYHHGPPVSRLISTFYCSFQHVTSCLTVYNKYRLLCILLPAFNLVLFFIHPKERKLSTRKRITSGPCSKKLIFHQIDSVVTSQTRPCLGFLVDSMVSITPCYLQNSLTGTLSKRERDHFGLIRSLLHCNTDGFLSQSKEV